MNKLLLSFAALAFLAACEAGTPPAGSAAPGGAQGGKPGMNHFVLHAPGSNAVEALIENDQVTGSEISVARYQTPSEHAIRGTAFGQPVDVAINGKKASGMLGSGPLDISTEHREGKIHVSGLVGGTSTDFEFNMKVLKGKIGQCLYDLSWTGNVYEGTRGCGRSAEPVAVAMPPSLGKWSDAEIGVCLGILMGNPSTEQFSASSVRSMTNPNLGSEGANPAHIQGH